MSTTVLELATCGITGDHTPHGIGRARCSGVRTPRICGRCEQPVIMCAHSRGVAWDHAEKRETGPCAGLLVTYDAHPA